VGGPGAPAGAALLILDTHLLSNILWSRALFADCPPWIEQALNARHYDLHLLLRPEGVAWVGDGMRCQPELAQRQQFLPTAWIGCRHSNGPSSDRGRLAPAQCCRPRRSGALLDGQVPACATEC
jgi:hypothetical protein